MAINDLKQELLVYIENTNDEELLSLRKEDFVFYGKVKDADITASLSEDQLKELKDLSEEDDMKNPITLDEYKRATEPWRTR